MARIRLIHWNAQEASARGRQLARSGHRVDARPVDAKALKEIKAEPPDVIVIDLSRMPSQGRDLGVMLRRHGTTRRIPLVFLGGDPLKVARVRELLPDATYAMWDAAPGAIAKAARRSPRQPVVPSSSFAAYAGTPLSKKLGIRKGAVVALVGAPEGFEGTLGKLPEGVTLRRGARGKCDLAVWFARSRGEVEKRARALGEFAGPGGLWIAWPKRSSGVSTDLTQAVVREVGLSVGLVDYKVCSIDDTWSALRFKVRGRGGSKR